MRNEKTRKMIMDTQGKKLFVYESIVNILEEELDDAQRAYENYRPGALLQAMTRAEKIVKILAETPVDELWDTYVTKV